MKFIVEINHPEYEDRDDLAEMRAQTLKRLLRTSYYGDCKVTVTPMESKPPTEEESQASLNALRAKLTGNPQLEEFKRRYFTGDINSPELSMFRQYLCDNPECPQAGHCGGECSRNF